MKWIRPQDELPELINHDEFGIYSDYVLIDYNGMYHLAYLHDGFWNIYDSGLDIEIEDVTCWAPIAPPPKEWLNDEEEPPA